MMEIICLNDKGHTNLIKGKIYKCKSVYDYHKQLRDRYNRYNADWVKELLNKNNVTDTSKSFRCTIKGLQSDFPLSMFKKVNDDGKLSDIPHREFNHIENIWLRSDDVEVGDILVCKTKKLKTLTYEKYYIIEDKSGFSVKLKGMKNSRYYSLSNFSKVPTDKVREMNIDELFGESEELTLKTTKYDELNHLDNLEELLILLRPIVESIEFLKKTEIRKASIMDIIDKKYLGKSSLKSSDFDKLKDMKWEEILQTER